MKDINLDVKRLVAYAVRKQLIEESDRIYATNALMEVLTEDHYMDVDGPCPEEPVEDILHRIRLWAVENEKVENDSNELLDLLDTKLMGVFVSKPSEYMKKFWAHYGMSPKSATEFSYDFARATNYIREQRVAKDVKWIHETPFGPLDLTINLSKPEKDPRVIAKARTAAHGAYPQCLLCKENEGYAGRLDYPARQNHRIIPLTLAGEPWFMQYSPYVYYNEHCIVFKGEHEPMKITPKTIHRLLDFVTLFPHYLMGSNADLPIVGGSILTHDHFQGGNFEFGLAKAKEENVVPLGNSGVEAGIVHWPMSVIRLKGSAPEELLKVATLILERWKTYSDAEVDLLAATEGEEHNTITPVVRFRKGSYEVDLILRNNRRDEQHPTGIFHTQPQYHHIKWENIGLIECMGLAVLPGRLKKEFERMKAPMLQGNWEAIAQDEELKKHKDFARDILLRYKDLSEENYEGILFQEIGEVFHRILLDCGIFKHDEKGRAAFDRCCEALYGDQI